MIVQTKAERRENDTLQAHEGDAQSVREVASNYLGARARSGGDPEFPAQER
jgi:hypothetical protein